KNRILNLAFGQNSLNSGGSYFGQWGQPLYLHEVGQSTGAMIGYVWDGNYQYSDFENPAPGQYILKDQVPRNGGPNPEQPGDLKLRDLNGDGTINSSDMTVIGRGQPIHVGGFSN